MSIAKTASLLTALLLALQPAARLAVCDCRSSERPPPRTASEDCCSGRAAADCAACRSSPDVCCAQASAAERCPCRSGICICISRSGTDDSALPSAQPPRTADQPAAALAEHVNQTAPADPGAASGDGPPAKLVVVPLQLCSELCRWRL